MNGNEGSDDISGPRTETKVDKSTSGKGKRSSGAAEDAALFAPSSLFGHGRGGDMDVGVEGVDHSSSTTSLQHGRKRTNSLRQAAMAKMRERIVVTPPTVTTVTTTTNTPSLDDTPAPRSKHEDPAPIPSSQSEVPLNSRSTLSPLDQTQRRNSARSTSPTFSCPEGPYISTTDEDEAVSLHYPQASSSNSSLSHTLADSAMSTTRRRPHRTELRTTLAATPPPTDLDVEDDWDHSETEWWGWVILTATWIVFVVVMGSCFGVWSWAWDVGETPYAPPDLENDDTLPITGYYPALIVCTAVMSWVWVVVAWVGLKYFRHAKVVADDG
jgi:hypothetical protein